MTPKTNKGAKNISEMVTVSRAFALISIVSAHILFSESAPEWLIVLYKMLGSVGVVSYFIISGYYFHPQKYDSFWELCRSKAVTVVLPWVVLGTVGFIYNALLSRDFSPIRYLKFIFGNGSYLWFVSMLLGCFVVFYFLRGIKLLWGAIAVSVLSLELTAVGVLSPVIQALHITNYINLLNWLGIFAIGLLLQKVNAEALWDKLVECRAVFISTFVVLFAALFVLRIPTGYFTYVGWFYELVGVGAVFAVASCPILNQPLVRRISNDSFTVYLIHFMVIGVFDGIYNRILPVQMMANLFVVAVSVCAIEAVLLFGRLVKREKLFGMLMGVRTR